MDLESVLKDLREKYISDLPEVIESIETLFSQKNLALVREEFHKLRGTGKTYGIDEISAVGEAVENLCVYYPESAEQLIPLGIRILQRIHATRSQGRIFDVAADTDFLKLQALVQKH